MYTQMSQLRDLKMITSCFWKGIGSIKRRKNNLSNRDAHVFYFIVEKEKKEIITGDKLNKHEKLKT